MEHSLKYEFLMSQLTHIQDIKDTEKTKLSIVFYQPARCSCILRICKNRDISQVCRALRAIRNGNTAVVYDYIYENGDTYILEENLSGQTVEEWLEHQGCFSEKDTAQIIIELCKALEVLHKEQPPVVHNDINPSNIMLCEDGTVKLFDFDIARTYKKGKNQNTMLLGTEEYASPEHFGYGQSAPATDVYCIGATMHRILTGKPLTSEHKPVYKGRLLKVLKKCLEIDPEKRYGSVSLLRRELEKRISGKRHWWKIVAAIGAAVLLISLWAVFGDWDSAKSSGKQDKPKHSISQEREDVQVNAQQNQLETLLPDREYAQTIREDQTENRYQFCTTDHNAVYRLWVNPSYNENPVNGRTVVVLYDATGIAVGKMDAEYGETAYTDMVLLPQNTYTIAIYGENTVPVAGDYLFSISERICDASIDPSVPEVLILDVPNEAVLNSTIGHYYMFTPEITGRYVLKMQNRNVGCRISVSAEMGGGSLLSLWAKNGTEISRQFYAEAGKMIQIQVDCDDPAGNGEYIIWMESVS